MRQTFQFLGLMAAGILLVGMTMLVVQAVSGDATPRTVTGFGARSMLGIDYVSFGIGLAMGLTLAELARLSWSDMPRRVVAWLIANRHNARYVGYACVSLVVLIYA